ncbi:MAG: hypothetical protein JO072_16790 [Parafilimonas sp.]|nr:hypothetical protein [Parafilimonas sp.]
MTTLLFAITNLKKLMEERLPDFVLSDLFSNYLVFTGENLPVASSRSKATIEKIAEEIPKPKKNYLGNYERKIVVLVSDAENIYLSDHNLNFLTGILNACKLNLAHIALINFTNNTLNFSNLKKNLQPEYLILFGLTALQIALPFTMPDYQVQEYNKCKILIAPSLNELNQQTTAAKTEKTKLWKSLQKIFDL